MVRETKPCIICGCELESAFRDDQTHFQPYKGGEVTFYFHYGSCKFDMNMFGTKFAGIICDDCAEKCIERMEMIKPSDKVPRLPTCYSETAEIKAQTKGLMDNLKRINEGKSPKKVPPLLPPSPGFVIHKKAPEGEGFFDRLKKDQGNKD